MHPNRHIASQTSAQTTSSHPTLTRESTPSSSPTPRDTVEAAAAAAEESVDSSSSSLNNDADELSDEEARSLSEELSPLLAVLTPRADSDSSEESAISEESARGVFDENDSDLSHVNRERTYSSRLFGETRHSPPPDDDHDELLTDPWGGSVPSHSRHSVPHVTITRHRPRGGGVQIHAHAYSQSHVNIPGHGVHGGWWGTAGVTKR